MHFAHHVNTFNPVGLPFIFFLNKKQHPVMLMWSPLGP